MTSPFPQITSPPQASAEVLVNEALETLKHQAVYGKKQSTTTGLTWGYYGGRWGGFSVADGTLALTNAATNYIVVAVASGVASVSTSATNWNDTTNYVRAYKLTAAGGVVTVEEDDRAGPGGVFGAAGGAGATIDTDGTLAANSDTVVASQKATKTYVDAKVAGLSWKQEVRAASTANGTLATAFANGQTIDGVTLATGDRILLKNQTTGSENGIYVVAASGAPTRATDADAGAELVDASVMVSEGTTLADTQWTCTTNAPITVGTTSLAFSQLSATAGITALTGDVAASGAGSVAATWNGGTASKAVNEAPTVTIASSSTPAIGAALSNSILLTGTVTVTGFDTIAAGAFRRVRFGGILTLTYNATSLILPTSASITTAADDVAEFLSLGSGNWFCTSYTRKSGAPLTSSGGGFTPLSFRMSYTSGTQSTGTGTFTKVPYNSASIDTGSICDTTNHRITPGFIGKMQINGACYLSAGGGQTRLMIYKNGTEIASGTYTAAGAADSIAIIADIVSFNATDYFELYIFTSSSATIGSDANGRYLYFSGFRIA